MFKNHPKGLLAAALSNMGERFGYYIMNAVLLLFLVSKFGLSDATGGLIYSIFYSAIYVLSLVGGIIADRTQNYKGTIQKGLIIMAAGYILLSIPITASSTNTAWLLPFTCLALALIAFGNGLFKGNLQAIVGQMYDNYEVEAAKEGPEALKAAKEKRDAGFQIFYVFINIGGLVAPFVAPLLRQWWLKTNGFLYNSNLPELCHRAIAGNLGDQADKYAELVEKVTLTGTTFDPSSYLEVFNQGVHFSFIASVLATSSPTRRSSRIPPRRRPPSPSPTPRRRSTPWPRKSSSACTPCSPSWASPFSSGSPSIRTASPCPCSPATL